MFSRRTLGRSRIAILGPGAVGSFLAALLSHRGHEVTCIGRLISVTFIQKKGIILESPLFGTFNAKPRSLVLLDRSVDVLFVTTKAGDLKSALQKVDPRYLERGVIIPLLNGIEHMDVLRAHFGKNVLAGSISIEVEKIDKLIVRHSSLHAHITLASDNASLKIKLDKAASFLADAGFGVAIARSEKDALWEKLARLNAISCVITAARKTLGEVRSDLYWRKKIEECVIEAAGVARLEGVVIDVQETMRVIDSFPPTLVTSLYRDITHGLPSELDAIAGAIVRKGFKHGFPCPKILELMQMISPKE